MILISILYFTGLNFCITFISVQNLTQSKKSRKVDAIASILRKIQNSIKFEPLFRFWLNLKPNYLHSIYNYQELPQNLNFAELGMKPPFFRKIQNFIKSEHLNKFLPNATPNVIEHRSFYKELFRSIAYNLR